MKELQNISHKLHQQYLKETQNTSRLRRERNSALERKDELAKQLKKVEDQAQEYFNRKQDLKNSLTRLRAEAKSYLERCTIAERRLRQLQSPGKIPTAQELNEATSVCTIPLIPARFFIKTIQYCHIARFHICCTILLISFQAEDKRRKFNRKCAHPDCNMYFNYHQNMIRHYKTFHSHESKFM